MDRLDYLHFLGHKRRQLMNAQLRTGNQLGAIERWASGKVKGRRSEVMSEADQEQGKAVAAELFPVLQPMEKALAKERRGVEKEMAGLVEDLPGWAFVSGTRGIGALGFALLVAETGDLAKYSCPSKVWKRMGLAVIDGERQRRIAGTTPGKTAEAIRHGFSPKRRALAFVLSESLLKQNKGEYRALYDSRKALELAKLPEDAKGRQGWAHRRALRFMFRRFLLHLWCAWNGKPMTLEDAAAAA